VIKIYYQQELIKKHKKQKNKKVQIKNTMNYSAKQNQSEGNLSSANSSNLNNNLDSDNLKISENDDVELMSVDKSEPENPVLGSNEDVNRDNNKITINNNNKNDDEKDKENQFKIHQLQQQNLYQKISNGDLKLLIKELKRKVDYTEKMNWLCEFLSKKMPTIFPAIIQISTEISTDWIFHY
jgi:hypothetical protein